MMENITENNAGKNDSSSETRAASLGTMLREARERLGLSVADVAGQIKFAPRQIEALEADDFPRLPEGAFLRGFVRSYAKILHLDANTMLAALPQNKTAQMELVPDLVGEPFPNVHSVLRQNYIWLGAALLLVAIAVAFALWQLTAPPAQPKPAQVESPVSLPAEVQVIPPGAAPHQIATEVAVSEPVVPKKRYSVAAAQSSVHAPNTVASRPDGPKHAATDDAQPDLSSPITSLHLVFDEESWAEIKDRNDKVLSSRIHPAGTEMRVNGRAPFSIVISHASSVSLYHQDKQVDLIPYIKGANEIARFTLQ